MEGMEKRKEAVETNVVHSSLFDTRNRPINTKVIFNICGKFRWSPEGPVNQIHSPHLHPGAPGIFSDLLRSIQMLKRDWGAESNGKLQHLFIPIKTATLVPEFVVEDLPLSRTVALVPEFAVKYVPLGRTIWWWWWWWLIQSRCTMCVVKSSMVGKNPQKTSPRKAVPTGDRTRARCVISAHATTCSTAVDNNNNNNNYKNNNTNDNNDHHQCSAQGQVFHCKLRQQGCNSAQRQVLHCKLRNLVRTFTKDE